MPPKKIHHRAALGVPGSLADHVRGREQDRLASAERRHEQECRENMLAFQKAREEEAAYIEFQRVQKNLPGGTDLSPDLAEFRRERGEDAYPYPEALGADTVATREELPVSRGSDENGAEGVQQVRVPGTVVAIGDEYEVQEGKIVRKTNPSGGQS
jgi:hypothetical protein